MDIESSSSPSPSTLPMSYQCTICLEEVGETDKVVTKCNHVFHASCLFQNNTHGNTCPNCREVIAPRPPKIPKMNEDVAASIVQPIINSFPAVPMTKSIYNTFRDGLQVRSTSTHGPGNGKILPNEYSMLPESVKLNLEADLKFAMAEIGLKTCQDIGRWIKYYNEESLERERSLTPSPEPNESPIPEAQRPYNSDEEETDPEMPDLLDDNGNVMNSDDEQENFLENTGQEMVNILNDLINESSPSLPGNEPWSQGESIDPWPRLSTPSPIHPASALPLLNDELDNTPPPPPPPPSTIPPPRPPVQPTEQEIRSSYNRYLNQYQQEQHQRWHQYHYQMYLQSQQYSFNPYNFFHPPAFVVHQSPAWNTVLPTSQPPQQNPSYSQTNIADLTYY